MVSGLLLPWFDPYLQETIRSGKGRRSEIEFSGKDAVDHRHGLAGERGADLVPAAKGGGVVKLELKIVAALDRRAVVDEPSLKRERCSGGPQIDRGDQTKKSER